MTMRARFVKPEAIRLPLSNGDWIDVKKRLNTGETRRLFARMARDIRPGEKYSFNPEQIGLAKVLEYLLAWSFTDDARPVPYSLEMSVEQREGLIGNLDPDDFVEIREAIEAHEERISEAREKEKKERDGEHASKATSPSPDSVIGATTGSLS